SPRREIDDQDHRDANRDWYPELESVAHAHPLQGAFIALSCWEVCCDFLQKVYLRTDCCIQDTEVTHPAMTATTVPRLYHAPSSYYSMIARLALAEGGVAYHPVFMEIHVRTRQQEPDYVRLNPNMTVPTLVLADRILDQSRDIAEYALGVNEAA